MSTVKEKNEKALSVLSSEILKNYTQFKSYT